MRYGGYKYDDDTGEFRDVPGAKKKSRVAWSWQMPRFHIPTFRWPRLRLPRLDWKSALSCLAKPLYYLFYPFVKWWKIELEAVRDQEWFMVFIWLFPGFILLAIYRLVLVSLLAFESGALSSVHVNDSLTLFLVIGAFVTYVILYAKALALVRMGELTVYCDWEDFLKSAAWIVAAPLGLCWGLGTGGDWLVKVVGGALVVLGAWSFWHMLYGAFVYNRGSKRWLALFARMAVVLLAIFALAKLNERIDKFRRNELGVIQGVLIPLAVFVMVFNWLIRPMVGGRRHRLC